MLVNIQASSNDYFPVDDILPFAPFPTVNPMDISKIAETPSEVGYILLRS